VGREYRTFRHPKTSTVAVLFAIHCNRIVVQHGYNGYDDDDFIEEGQNGTSDNIEGVLGEEEGGDEEQEGLEWYELNRLALDAVTRRIESLVPKFMKIGGVKDPDKLSFTNPPYSKPIRYQKSSYNWWKFLEQMHRDLFPELTHDATGISRIAFGVIIIRNVIIPIASGKVDHGFKLDVNKIEEEINELVAEKSKKKK